jgi:hypothetical protein
MGEKGGVMKTWELWNEGDKMEKRWKEWSEKLMTSSGEWGASSIMMTR